VDSFLYLHDDVGWNLGSDVEREEDGQGILDGGEKTTPVS
jgi:hypothetical protein